MTANDAFLRLHEDLNWFVMCPEIRVLHIATSATERSVVLEQVAATEAHGDNRSPFAILEDAHTRDEPGWLARAERMRVIHEVRRLGMVKEGYALDVLPALQHGENALATMAWQLAQCLEAQHRVPELAGLAVVLAPTVLEQPDRFAESVHALLRIPQLAPLRFIVVELGQHAAEPLLARLGDAGMRAECIVDAAQHHREQSETLAAMAGALPAASANIAAGHAGPRDVCAPPRAGEPPRDAPVSSDVAQHLAQELGPAAALLGASGAAIKRRIAGAAIAMQERRFSDAIRLQSEACEQCWQAGLTRMGCILESSLAAYFLHAGDAARAHGAFDVAAGRAAAAGLHDVAAQALLGLAAVLVLQKNFHGGVLSYTRAGEAAERAQMPQLAIEAYRTAGQVALRAGAEDGAVSVWKRALGVVAQAGPEIAAASSAPVVARALAKLVSERGEHANAQSLLDQADAYERQPPPKTADTTLVLKARPSADAPEEAHAR
ncbi:hypothetical protein [Pendulispora albinea]|uniref:Uncharacterized protein n=1 Tax=Pendulispora albinea TaxID=2741071 RepID=A0ABZ2MAJ5_9BACT